MSLTIGRLGLDVIQTDPATLSQSGNDVKIGGRLSAVGDDATFLREQLQNLKDNPHELFYPVTYDEFPWVNGYYTVEESNVDMVAGSLVTGWFTFNLSLTRIPNSAVPLMESRLLGSLRPNAVSYTTCVGWQAVPDEAMGYVGATATDTRQTEEGAIRVYSAGADGLLANYTSFLLPPENWYDSSARIRTGLADALDVATFEYTGAAQTYVVPAGVSKLQVDLRGAQGGGRLGGRGARIRCLLDVTPGETLTINVGGQGGLPTNSLTSTNGSGGWNGGGDGNQGQVTIAAYAYGHGGDGWGGGGATDLRQAGTALANRVVVAGGGGGMGGCLPTKTDGYSGGLGGTNGGPAKNTNGTGGKGATQGAGGGPGVTTVSGGHNGTAGTLGQGGKGAYALASSDHYGSGGGGGGLYGGGGGSEARYLIAAGSGGGGSSLHTGQAAATASGSHEGSGLAIIVPITDDTSVNRYTVVGDQAIDSAFGWELSNGLISVRPVYTGDRFAVQLRCWNGDDWSDPREWFYSDDGTTTPTTMRLVSAKILRNNPAECAIRCLVEYNDKLSASTVTISLRRGSPIASFRWASTAVKTHGMWTAGTYSSTARTGNGFSQTSLAADGVGVLGVCPFLATRVITSHNGFYLGVDQTKFEVGLGFDADQFTDSAQDLVDQWYAAQTETVRPVIA